jgi:hypothetical protein
MRSNDGLNRTTLGFSGLTKPLSSFVPNIVFSFFIAFKADVERISENGTIFVLFLKMQHLWLTLQCWPS